MNQKYLAERSCTEYVDLDMQLRDERCMLLSVSVHGRSNVTQYRQHDRLSVWGQGRNDSHKN